jgi:hypothetical protein
MPGFCAMITGFSRSAAVTADRACPPFATAHHEPVYEGCFDGNKRVSIQKPLKMSGFAISAAIQRKIGFVSHSPPFTTRFSKLSLSFQLDGLRFAFPGPHVHSWPIDFPGSK